MTQLDPLPDHRQRVIVVGASVRKPLDILQPFLNSLAYQELPPQTVLHFCFIPDFEQPNTDAEQFLREWVKERNGECLRGVPGTPADFREGPNTHEWSLSSMRRVGQNKNKILQRALELKADAVFLCDADLILDRTTLASLLATERHLATAVYWTYWNKEGQETRQIHAAPQVWLRHPYGLDGRGMDAAEFRQKLVAKELTRVWGFGACTLIGRRVLEAGIDFSPVPEVPQTGLMAGEDRQFCIKCERGHLEAFADPWPDIFHIYHRADDVPQIPEMVARLGRPHPLHARLGDLVSLRLHALEPIPRTPTQASIYPPHFARGRLGQLSLMPELEEAVYGLARGEKQIVRIHCAAHHPFPFYRGRARLLEMQLIDCKPWGAPPVLEQELYVGSASRTTMDHTDLTTEMHEGIKEMAAVNG